MTKKENFRRKQYFSIRKYKMGACSVLLGTSLFLSLNYTDEVKAAEVKEVTTHAVDKDSLSDQIKKELKVFEENKIEVEKGREYYFVYKKNNLLHNTGSLSAGTALLGGALLLVCLTLVKKRKGKLIFLASILTVSGSVNQAMALSDFEEISPAVVKVVSGGMLPSPDAVNGYSFTGFYFEKETQVNKLDSVSKDTMAKEVARASAGENGNSLVQLDKSESEVKPTEDGKQPEKSVGEMNHPTQPEQSLAGKGQNKQPEVSQSERQTDEQEQGKQPTPSERLDGEIEQSVPKVEHKTTPEEGVLNAIVEKPELVVSTEVIPFEIITQDDATLPKGKTKVIQDGVSGERTIYTEVSTVNGEKSSKVVENIITKQPVNKIVAVGTKEEVAPQPKQPEATNPVSEEKPTQPKQPEVTNPVSEEKPTQPKQPEVTNPVSEEKPTQPKQPEVTNPVSEEKPTKPKQLEATNPVSEEKPTKPKQPEATNPVSEEKPAQPKQPEATNPVSEEKPAQPKQPEVTNPVSEEKPTQQETTKPIPQPTTEEKVLEYKTIYKPSLALGYKEQQEEVAGENGKEIITTSYSLDKSTGEIVKSVSTKIEKPAKDKVIKVGNVEETITTKKRNEQFIADESKAAGIKEVKNEGQDEETTTIKVYKVNAQTGELTEPEVSTKVAKAMQPKITAVGTKPTVQSKEISFETHYKADSTLAYNQKVEETLGENGNVTSTTKYTVNQETGAISEETTTENTPAKDRVVKVGNVEKIVKPIEITELRKEDPDLPKGKEFVQDSGEQGEKTITKTYTVNSKTGELINPTEKTETTKAMRPKVILVGTKEDKPHLLPSNKELENAVNVTEATAEMRKVDLLTNEKLKSQLAPSETEINRDLFLKRNELRKTNPNITDAEVKEVLRKEYLEKLSIKETLEETKQNLDENLKKVAAHTLSIIGDTPQNREKVKRDIEDNKEKILLGLSYINRFYNIDFGDTNIRDILAYNPSSFGKKDVTSLDWLKHLGTMSYDELKLTNSPKTFEKYFGKITDKQTLLDFLDYNRTTFTNMDGDTWLKKATKAIVVEKASKQKPDEKVELYTKLTTPPEKYGAEELQIKNRRQHNIATLLGLVNIKEPSVYAITNIATVTYGNIGTYMDTSLEKTNKAKYDEELNKIKELIELTATRQANYVDTLYRITKAENRPKLITNRLIVDTMKKYTPNEFAGIATTWSKESGPTADKGVKDFMTPLGLYSPSQIVGAEANGVGVRYFIDRVLDDRGSATYSHEMTHLLDRTVLFNNHGRRDGTAAEFYARGIFENSYTPEKDTYFNLNFVFDESNKNGFYNKTPDRFKTAADLKSYMHGSFDVLYSLDYLEAEATKQLTAEEKTKYFKKITPIASTGTRTPVAYTNQAVKATHNSEKISEITLDEARNLSDINSLIDNNILVNRYIINGFKAKDDVKANGYYLVDMFDTIFGVSENPKGMSGDITFRKQAFELMGALGYYEGFVPYVSNQYKQQAEVEGVPLSDKYIFDKILRKSYAEFKKEQINERVIKLDRLKPITINYNGKQQVIDSKEKLQELMNKAVREEVAQIKAGNTTAKLYKFIETPVQKLKKEIYKAYLRQSQDFTESIYKN
ncbi:ZmpA/ZmpB/ZmpC family metallo-endopeptidase [Gemella sp.]